MNFKDFFILAESYEQDIKKTLSKIPKKHQALIRGYKFKFQSGNELKGDHESVGLVDREKKTITIAAPYNFGREFCILHEIGHLVWETLDKDAQKKWRELIKKYPAEDSPKQAADEYFSMAYANTHVYNQVKKFCIDAWHKFVQGL